MIAMVTTKEFDIQKVTVAAASLFQVSKSKKKKTGAFQACHAQSGEGIFYFLGYEMQQQFVLFEWKQLHVWLQ